MRNHIVAKALVLTGMLAVTGAAFAQDEGLYEAPVDPNSAFVRVLAPAASVAVINGSSMDELQGGLSPYVNVKPGSIAVSAGEAAGSVEAAAGSYYTYAWDAAGSAISLTDKTSNDPAKADVYLYNLSDKPEIDLFVPAAKVNAIAATPTAGSKSVSLKAPLKIDVEVKAGGETIGKLDALELTRRGGISIIVSGTNGTYDVVAVKNVYIR